MRVKAKAARTEWRAVWHDVERNRTLVELRPHSGRTHQLRVHLAAMGHPILGDSLYAPPSVRAASPGRLMLHSCSLALVNPCTQTRITFQSPCPFWPATEETS